MWRDTSVFVKTGVSSRSETFFNDLASSVTVFDAIFVALSSWKEGGALFFSRLGGTLTLLDVLFDNCAAVSHGGAVYVIGAGEFYVNSVNVINCCAQWEPALCLIGCPPALFNIGLITSFQCPSSKRRGSLYTLCFTIGRKLSVVDSNVTQSMLKSATAFDLQTSEEMKLEYNTVAHSSMDNVYFVAETGDGIFTKQNVVNNTRTEGLNGLVNAKKSKFFLTESVFVWDDQKFLVQGKNNQISVQWNVFYECSFSIPANNSKVIRFPRTHTIDHKQFLTPYMNVVIEK